MSSISPMPGSNPTYTSHAAVASAIGSSISTIFVWDFSLVGITPPAQVQDAITVLATVLVAMLSSVLMKKFNILSD